MQKQASPQPGKIGGVALQFKAQLNGLLGGRGPFKPPAPETPKEKPVEKPIDKPSEKPVESPAEKPAEIPLTVDVSPVVAEHAEQPSPAFAALSSSAEEAPSPMLLHVPKPKIVGRKRERSISKFIPSPRNSISEAPASLVIVEPIALTRERSLTESERLITTSPPASPSASSTASLDNLSLPAAALDLLTPPTPVSTPRPFGPQPTATADTHADKHIVISFAASPAPSPSHTPRTSISISQPSPSLTISPSAAASAPPRSPSPSPAPKSPSVFTSELEQRMKALKERRDSKAPQPQPGQQSPVLQAKPAPKPAPATDTKSGVVQHFSVRLRPTSTAQQPASSRPAPAPAAKASPAKKPTTTSTSG